MGKVSLDFHAENPINFSEAKIVIEEISTKFHAPGSITFFFLREILTDALRVMVNNPFLKSFYEKKLIN